MSRLIELPAWKALDQKYQQINTMHMRDMFAHAPDRFAKYSRTLGDLLFDYSKNRIDDEVMSSLMDLARQTGLEEARQALFNGERLNFTEDRSVFHMACRNRSDRAMTVDGQDVMGDVRTVLDQMRRFCDQVRSGHWVGATGKKVTHIVNIGIGGSDLGIIMALQALRKYQLADLKPRFVSNADSSHIYHAIEDLDPETTLFVIASKTFTTQETLLNAKTARRWLVKALGEEAVAKHFVAVSTNQEKVVEFGIDPANMFPFWNWVGGRYSVWASIGLSVALVVGMDNFEAMLAGGHAVDEHFRTTPFEDNIPVIMGLLGVWYSNFFKWSTHAILPYDQYLSRFPAYVQQMDMESNGKRTDRNGEVIADYTTGPVVFGHTGTNAQHSFFQHLHQGRWRLSLDFIGVAQNHHDINGHQTILLSHFLAQSTALMLGKSLEEVKAELRDKGMSEEEITRIAPHRVFPGNRPSNSIMIPKVTPYNLGMLMALYEHKVFVQGIIWGINSFDQFGVELGKELANKIVPELNGEKPRQHHNASTDGLMDYILRMKG